MWAGRGVLVLAKRTSQHLILTRKQDERVVSFAIKANHFTQGIASDHDSHAVASYNRNMLRAVK